MNPCPAVPEHEEYYYEDVGREFFDVISIGSYSTDEYLRLGTMGGLKISSRISIRAHIKPTLRRTGCGMSIGSLMTW
jgi:hypothetical protein